MIVFNAPKRMAEDSVGIDVTGVLLGKKVVIYFDWLDAAGNVLESDSRTLTGADATQVKAAQITAGKVGKSHYEVIQKGAETKLKNMLGIAGTVE